MVATKSAPKGKTPDAVLARAEKTANQELVAKVDEIKAHIRALTETDIKKRWELGKEIRDVMTDDSGKYGDDPSTMVQALMPLSKDSLRPMVVMAERYEEADIDTLIALRHPRTGEGLTWSHVMSLSRVKDKSKALALADKTVKSGWSSKDLAREVTALAGGPTSKGGRKSKKPDSLSAGLADVASSSDAWVNKSDTAWMPEGGLSDLLAAINPNPKTVSELEAALASVDRLTAQSAIMGRQLSAMIIQTKAVLNQRVV